ncbi:MAG: glycosyltransferase [Erysipelotrichaceae bacterium]|nr:glycosyltransferase [Erysipelotrichaceae bacterium]
MMKKKILFINTVNGFASTGNISADLCRLPDYETLLCYGRKKNYTGVDSFKFANLPDNISGALSTIFFDNNLNICKRATKRLIHKIKEFDPDIIHLHNLHGYYLNVELLFSFLKNFNKPVIWTLHDCWSMTGYCPHFDYLGCDKYKTLCKECPYGFSYPFSLFKQNVESDYFKKKELFNSIDNLTIVTPSKWLEGIVRSSFLKNCKLRTIHNGIKLEKFKPTRRKNERFTVLAVSSIWTKQKGIDDLNKIIPLLDKDIDVIAVGSGSNQIKNCKAIKRTNNIDELIDLYSASHLLINPTLQEVFGLVNVEALACDTPVIAYNTGGCPEVINDDCGRIIDKGNYKSFASTIIDFKNNYIFDPEKLIERSKQFDYRNMINSYDQLYKELLN